MFACGCELLPSRLMPKLRELDCALVIEEMGVGTFMGGISPSDPGELKKRVYVTVSRKKPGSSVRCVNVMITSVSYLEYTVHYYGSKLIDLFLTHQ
jgi:hypothetical protein